MKHLRGPTIENVSKQNLHINPLASLITTLCNPRGKHLQTVKT